MIKSLYKTFQHWSDGGSVWMISDTHFGDSDCKYMDKNWIEPQEQIDIINTRVFKNDYLIHLGDVGSAEWVEKIKCQNRVLILGNHDKPSQYEGLFKEVYSGPLFIADRILLSHEPIFGLESICLNIHGHDHYGMHHDRHVNLAVNVNGYMPENLGALIKTGGLADIPSIHRTTIDLANRAKAEKRAALNDRKILL